MDVQVGAFPRRDPSQNPMPSGERHQEANRRSCLTPSAREAKGQEEHPTVNCDSRAELVSGFRSEAAGVGGMPHPYVRMPKAFLAALKAVSLSLSHESSLYVPICERRGFPFPQGENHAPAVPEGCTFRGRSNSLGSRGAPFGCG